MKSNPSPHPGGTVPADTGKEREMATKAKRKRQIVRTYSAGVFFGVVESRKGKEAVLRDARRLCYWKGAASLSELAIRGVKYPDECKFPDAVDRMELMEVIEILDVTDEATKSIDGVKPWRA